MLARNMKLNPMNANGARRRGNPSGYFEEKVPSVVWEKIPLFKSSLTEEVFLCASKYAVRA